MHYTFRSGFRMTKSGSELYQEPADYEALFNPGLADLGFYRRVLEGSGGPALELGCGTGRLLWPLRQAGLDIEGLDVSAAMLTACAARGAELGLSAPLHEGDWRRFDLKRRFAALILPFNGLQHLASAQDLDDFFARIRAHLQPGGLFAFDVHLPQASLLARDGDERFGVDAGPSTPDGERVVAEQSRYDALTQVLTQTWTLADRQGKTRELSLKLRQFFPEELGVLLKSQGLKVMRRESGFDGEDLGSESLKQVLVTQLM